MRVALQAEPLRQVQTQEIKTMSKIESGDWKAEVQRIPADTERGILIGKIITNLLFDPRSNNDLGRVLFILEHNGGDTDGKVQSMKMATPLNMAIASIEAANNLGDDEDDAYAAITLAGSILRRWRGMAAKYNQIAAVAFPGD